METLKEIQERLFKKSIEEGKSFDILQAFRDIEEADKIYLDASKRETRSDKVSREL